MPLPAQRLSEDPLVAALALVLDELDTFAVAGRLRSLWERFAEHAPNNAGVISMAAVDLLVACDGFADALNDEEIVVWDEGSDQFEIRVWKLELKSLIGEDCSDHPAFIAGYNFRKSEEHRAELALEQAKRDRERTKKARQRARQKQVCPPSVPGTSPPCPRDTGGHRGDIAVFNGEKSPEVSIGTENAALAAASYKDKEKTKAGHAPNETASLLALLESGGLDEDSATLILAHPSGFRARIEWAIRKLSDQSAKNRRRGGKIGDPGAYLKHLILKVPEGPRLPGCAPGFVPMDPLEIGGADRPSNQQLRLNQLAALRKAAP